MNWPEKAGKRTLIVSELQHALYGINGDEDLLRIEEYEEEGIWEIDLESAKMAFEADTQEEAIKLALWLGVDRSPSDLENYPKGFA